MALQTRFAELFLAAKRSQPGAATTAPPPTAEPRSEPRESAPPPTGYRSDPAPRVSLTQFVGNTPGPLQASNDGVGLNAPFGPGASWEHISGVEVVDWWLREGSGVAGSRALEQVMALVALGTGFHDRWERLCDARATVAELAPMLAALEVAPVVRDLLLVGLAPGRTLELRTLTLAFIQLEAPSSDAEPASSRVVERASVLRAELIAACSWHLRGRRELCHLARITDSLRSSELAMDLTELADLLIEHEAAFALDHTFCPGEAADLAINLACKLRSEQLQCAPCAGHECGLRTQVFSLLMDCASEIQAAAAHGLRQMPNWARVFGPLRNVARRRSRLRDTLGV